MEDLNNQTELSARRIRSSASLSAHWGCVMAFPRCRKCISKGRGPSFNCVLKKMSPAMIRVRVGVARSPALVDNLLHLIL